jgi:hypothetical protein
VVAVELILDAHLQAEVVVALVDQVVMPVAINVEQVGLVHQIIQLGDKQLELDT